MPGGIVPAENVKPVLSSPLGLKVFFEDESYPNPNRFFSHWTFYKYFNTMPLYFQKFTDPLNAVYLSSAFAKTLIQILLIFFIAFASSQKIKSEGGLLITAVIASVFFQTHGYRSYMGIIDQSTTYVFFYALPIVLLLLFFTPLYLKYFLKRKLKNEKYFRILAIPLAVICSLSGPLNPGISLIIILLVLVNFTIQHGSFQKLKFDLRLSQSEKLKDFLFYILPIGIFSTYSLVLGKFDSIGQSIQVPLFTLYEKLPIGLFKIMTEKIGYPLLLAGIMVNLILLNRYLSEKEASRLKTLLKWIVLFIVCYLLLLPLGGYREYRPNLLRYDTMIPVTLALIFFFTITTINISNNFKDHSKTYYTIFISIILLVFTFADKPNFDANNCQKQNIRKLAKSREKLVVLDEECNVLSWTKITVPTNSRLQMKLLELWGICDNDKLFYQHSAD